MRGVLCPTDGSVVRWEAAGLREKSKRGIGITRPGEGLNEKRLVVLGTLCHYAIFKKQTKKINETKQPHQLFRKMGINFYQVSLFISFVVVVIFCLLNCHKMLALISVS